MASPNQVFRAAGEPDVAWLDIWGGLTLYAWRDGSEVRATIYITHEQGQQTVLYDGVVVTTAANHTPDSVRCVQVADRYLVVFWLDRDTVAGTYTLESKYTDTEGFDAGVTWTSLSSIAMADAGLYDVKQIENPTSTGEYMFVRAGTTTTCVVRRVTGPDHTTNVAWSTTITSNHAERVLAVHGDGGASANNGGVIVVYQDADNDLIGHILDHSDGSDLGQVGVASSTGREHTAVGIARTTSPTDLTNATVAVIAEYEDAATNETQAGLVMANDEYAHWIVMVGMSINAFAGTNTNAHTVPNLNLMSKPYSYTDAEGNRSVYCGLGFKSVLAPAQWDQHIGFVCDMLYQEWDRTANTVRPHPVLTLNLANVDADVHAANPEATAVVSAGIGKRMNHLSNWIEGPKALLCDTRKSRTVAWPVWSRQTNIVDDELIFLDSGSPATETFTRPAGPGVRAVIHYLEDPWTRNRDETETSVAPTINFHGSNPLSLYATAESADSLAIAGGTPQLYDGRFIVELGFPWVPEIVSIDDVVDGSGIAAGTYTYVAVYEWTDAQGQLHRSGHSRPVAIELDVTERVSLLIRTLTIGKRDNTWMYPTAEPIAIAVYRNTLATPNRYFRVHTGTASPNRPQDIPLNTPTTWVVTVQDAADDVDLEAAPELFFIADGAQQSQFPPFQPPAAHACATWRNRLWLISSETPKELWYSYPLEGTALTGKLAPEFTPAFVFKLEAIKGDVTALQPMDDALIIFTRDGIYSLTGDGFVGIDTVTSSLALQVVHEHIGCIEPRSVALTTVGIMFQAYSGLHILDKGLALDHVSAGAPIEDDIATSGNLRSGTNLGDRHTVVFAGNDAVTDAPVLLKYEYYQRQWSKDVLEPPNTTAWLSSSAAACAWRGNARDLSHVVLCQGNLLIERGKDDSTPYRDETDTSAVRRVFVDIETGWCHFAGIAGYVRCYEIAIQVDDQNAAGAIYTELDSDRTGDYSTAAPEEHRFGGIYHATLPGYLPIKPEVQRMTAFRLRVFEADDPDNEGPLTITGFTALVGTQRGLRRVSNATRGVAV